MVFEMKAFGMYTYLFNYCHRLLIFQDFEKAEVIILQKPGKDPKFNQVLRPINLLSTRGEIFQEVILKIDQRHI
jgi:hypothetical protein